MPSDDKPMTWELLSCFRSDGFDSVGGDSLQLDRNSGEIGLIQQHAKVEADEYILAQDDNGDGVFFQALNVVCLVYPFDKTYKKVCIFTDSQVAKNSHQSNTSNSKLVNKYRRSIMEMAEHLKLYLIWVTSYR